MASREPEVHTSSAWRSAAQAAIVEAIAEAVVVTDTHGSVVLLNRRAAELFEVDPEEYVGRPAVELLRVIARETEDPEGFMEAFQELRSEADAELTLDVEQIAPARRHLRLLSRPARLPDGLAVARIDVYTDVSELVRRSQEIDRLYEEARKTAESYQRGLLPGSVPNVPRVNMVAHYVAAAGRRAVCGDFYDFVMLRGGEVGVLLGDVCGIGPAAANDAALARYTLRSFVDDRADPAELLQRLNVHLLDHLPSDRFIRLLFGVLDPERAAFTYANAGHVPPVRYRARSGDVEWLGEGGLPLGIEPDAAYKVGCIELEPGDMLITYTDGVTEAPRNGRPLGQGRFGDLVRDYGRGSPGELVQALRRSVQSWVTGELRDDLAMIVCQVVPDEAIDDQVRELVLPNHPARLSQVRAFVNAFLADVRAPVDVSNDVVLAVNEAASNSAKYARSDAPHDEIRIRCALQRGTVSVTVADEGPGFEPDPPVESQPPDRFALGGRGLFLMHHLMDSVDIERSPGGTGVTLTRRLWPRRPAPARRDT